MGGLDRNEETHLPCRGDGLPEGLLKSNGKAALPDVLYLIYRNSLHPPNGAAVSSALRMEHERMGPFS